MAEQNYTIFREIIKIIKDERIKFQKNFLIKSLSLLIAIFVIGSASAQQKQVNIYGLPNLNKGFLIWNCDDVDREFYRVHIMENTITPTDTTVQQVEMYELHDINYVKIKDAYWKNPQPSKWYTVEVEAYNSSNNVIDSSEEILQDVLNSVVPEDGSGEVICNWECVSSNYAYRIMAVDNNGYNYTQQITYDYYDENAGIGVPHYRWFSVDEFNWYVYGSNGTGGTGSPTWHGMPGGWDIPQNTEDLSDVGGKIIRLDNTQDSYFCDSQGAEITSPKVWGIQKALGPWAGGKYYYRIGLTANHCGDADMWYMINFLNDENENGIPNIPTLACDANLAEGCGPGGDHTGGSGGFDEVEVDPDCGVVFNYTSEWGGGAIGSSIDSDFGCLADDGDITDGAVGIGTFLASTELFQIVRLDENPKTILLSSGEDYVDSTGTPISMSINLDPGLYKILAKTPNKGLRYTLADVKNNTNISLQHKDYFDALVFPNPLTDDIFKIHIQTSARLNVQYDIYDAQGNPLWSQKFNLPKDHDADHTINHNVQLPSGVILHKFEFEDGSIETYTTLKM